MKGWILNTPPPPSDFVGVTRKGSQHLALFYHRVWLKFEKTKNKFKKKWSLQVTWSRLMIIMKSYFLVKVISNPIRGLQNMPNFWLCIRRKTHPKALMLNSKTWTTWFKTQTIPGTSPMNFDGGI
jgi:hypothetical protein